ncbi:MAG: mandelate racemase/muconate lactonizing enzyme family protein [Rhodocyclaceae bacterium]|nr:mandelate racemase/muconate lactonizing enzyme family protein [Pseudomonadota bacterium]MDQ7970945.1 mandelate racemase/muconate lactonizing enzyme family protein [Rhodocyclaceae bacterium]MDQ7998824.1 mandelate racemase/muconate lactonizing enzyme family protein [Pseudomonadota bacterium]MDQ8015672.1 mandelate racemase/muconate lactonizing enzyme family protein [Pseudomonadota bacterium]
MKITQVETVRLGEFPNILWVRLHTDEGLVGLGETFMGAAAVEAYLHEWAAPKLLGADPLAIEARNRDLTGYLGWRGSGVETRGNSAVDIALWDLFGKAANMPVHTALGGKSRDAIRIYNTCAGYQYVRSTANQSTSNWGLGPAAGGRPNPAGPYEDLQGFLHHADELAESLLSEGITAMKIWPFDPAAEKSHGQYISNADLDTALEPFRKIRSAVGRQMDIMVEFHSLWRLPMAQKIARALQEFDTFWHEDAIRMDSLDLLRQYAVDCKALVCASETLSYKWGFKDYLQTGVAGVAMLDLSWCGGLTEARKIAAMADAWQLPVAPHDCTGPVVWAASTHLSLHAPNALVQESVRAFFTGWYKELVTELPIVEKGTVRLNDKPGLGLELLPDLHKRPDATVRVSKA